MCRAASAVTAPSAKALTTMAFAAKRAPDREQPLQLAAVAQILDAAERGDNLLTHLRAVAAAFDDLEIGATARGLLAEIHARNRPVDSFRGAHMICTDRQLVNDIKA